MKENNGWPEDDMKDVSASEEYNNLHPMCEFHILAIKAYVDLLRMKNYSENTIKNYRNWFLVFLSKFPDRKASAISKNEILDFMLDFRNKPNWSATAQNQLINAIKFFYEHVLKRAKEMYDLPRPKKPDQLPTVYSQEEVIAIINATDNLKHKAILSFAYAGGLRISELVNMKIADIDSKRMVVYVRQAKGKKDRIVMLSEKLRLLLKEYYIRYRPKVWLFEGADGKEYSLRSISQVFQNCKKKAGVNKKGGIHTLRHSFATHLYEGGTDILSIKELLGHNSLRTTMGYTHVSKKHIGNIQSPFDKLSEL